MNRSAHSRRALLRAIGTSSLAAPFLSRLSFGAEPPRRLLVFFTPNEPIDRAHWAPPGQGASFKLTGLNPMLAPLEPFRDKLNLIGDLSMERIASLDKKDGGHRGIGWMLTGRPNVPTGPQQPDFWAGGISLDQFVAERFKTPAVTLGALSGGSSGNGRISYAGRMQPVHPQEDPKVAFDRTFQNVVPGKPGAGAGDAEARRLQQKSVLDTVAADLGDLSARLAAPEREKLDRHLSMIRDLEKQLQAAPSGAACQAVAPKSVPDHKTNAAYPRTSRLQMDVAVQALACQVTRVASVQLGNTGAGHLTPLWPDDGININKDEHNIAHAYSQTGSGPDVKNRELLESFYYRQFAYLLRQMEAVPEGNGTLLDHTLVFWVKNISHNHKWDPVFFMTAGGGAFMSTGRFLSFPGRPHNDLLSGICQKLGLSDVSSFGEPSVATEPLSI